jgi:hypothetical protein
MIPSLASTDHRRVGARGQGRLVAQRSAVADPGSRRLDVACRSLRVHVRARLPPLASRDELHPDGRMARHGVVRKNLAFSDRTSVAAGGGE